MQALYAAGVTGTPLAVIAAIAAGAVLVYRNWETLGPWFQMIWLQVQTVFLTAWTWIQENVMPIVQTVFADLVAGASSVYNWFVVNWPMISSTVTAVFNLIAQVWTDVLSLVFAAIVTRATQIYNTFLTLWPQILPILQQVFGGATESGGFFQQMLNFIWQTAIQLHLWWIANWPTISAVIWQVFAGIQVAWETVLLAVLTALFTLVVQIVQWFIVNWPMIQRVVGQVFGFIATVAWPMLQAVFAFLLQQAGVIVNWFITNWPLLQQTSSTVFNAVLAVIQFALNRIWSGVIVPVVTALVEFWTRNHEQIKNIVRIAWEFIKSFVSNLIYQVLDIIKLVMQIITGDWSGAWATSQRILARSWEMIKSVVKAAAGIVSNIIQIFGNQLVAKWQDLKSKSDAIWSRVVNNMIDKVEGGVNKVIGLLNKLTGAINTVAGLIGLEDTINIPDIPTASIPRMARGGILLQRNRPHAIYEDRVEPAFGLTEPEHVAADLDRLWKGSWAAPGDPESASPVHFEGFPAPDAANALRTGLRAPRKPESTPAHPSRSGAGSSPTTAGGSRSLRAPRRMRGEAIHRSPFARAHRTDSSSIEGTSAAGRYGYAPSGFWRGLREAVRLPSLPQIGGDAGRLPFPGFASSLSPSIPSVAARYGGPLPTADAVMAASEENARVGRLSLQGRMPVSGIEDDGSLLGRVMEKYVRRMRAEDWAQRPAVHRPAVSSIVGHGGERVLPESMTRAFDRLAEMIREWVSRGSPATSTEEIRPNRMVVDHLKALSAKSDLQRTTVTQSVQKMNTDTSDRFYEQTETVTAKMGAEGANTRIQLQNNQAAETIGRNVQTQTINGKTTEQTLALNSKSDAQTAALTETMNSTNASVQQTLKDTAARVQAALDKVAPALAERLESIKAKIAEVFAGVSESLSSLGSMGGNVDALLNVTKSAWGLAAGGKVTRPTPAALGEHGYDEYVIPTEPRYRGRAEQLLREVSQSLGYGLFRQPRGRGMFGRAEVTPGLAAAGGSGYLGWNYVRGQVFTSGISAATAMRSAAGAGRDGRGLRAHRADPPSRLAAGYRGPFPTAGAILALREASKGMLESGAPPRARRTPAFPKDDGQLDYDLARAMEEYARQMRAEGRAPAPLHTCPALAFPTSAGEDVSPLLEVPIPKIPKSEWAEEWDETDAPVRVVNVDVGDLNISQGEDEPWEEFKKRLFDAFEQQTAKATKKALKRS